MGFGSRRGRRSAPCGFLEGSAPSESDLFSSAATLNRPRERIPDGEIVHSTEVRMSSPLFPRRLDAHLLSRLLEDPQLAVEFRALPASVLRRIVSDVGLEDAGPLVALASFEQIRDIFDEDLWRQSKPGDDERFDPAPFIVWLEVLLEEDAREATGGIGGRQTAEGRLADRLVGFSEELLVFALPQLVWVMELSILLESSVDPHEAELPHGILDADFSEEFEGYLLVSRVNWGWEVIWTTILALDQHHPERLQSVLERCAEATHEEIRSAGELRSALDGEECLREDGRAERDVRRAERGHVSAADAWAFLALAKTGALEPEEDRSRVRLFGI